MQDFFSSLLKFCPYVSLFMVRASAYVYPRDGQDHGGGGGFGGGGGSLEHFFFLHFSDCKIASFIHALVLMHSNLSRSRNYIGMLACTFFLQSLPVDGALVPKHVGDDACHKW
jgi:hypothetical protein